MDKDQVFTDEAIRDQVDHTSGTAYMGEFNAETILVYNGLDQDVSFQLQGSIDDTTWIDVHDTFSIVKNTNDYAVVTHYFPSYRIVASCAVTPTTGNLNVWVVKSK